MKKFLLTAVLLAFANISFAGVTAGAFGYSQNKVCNSDCTVNIQEHDGFGWIVGYNTNGKVFVGGDAFSGSGGNNGFQGVDIKVGVKTNSFNISTGIGYIDDKTSATLAPRFAGTSSNKEVAPFAFVEVAHDSGVFARYSQYNVDHTQSFTTIDGRGNLIDSHTANTTTKNELVWVGYRLKF